MGLRSWRQRKPCEPFYNLHTCYVAFADEIFSQWVRCAGILVLLRRDRDGGFGHATSDDRLKARFLKVACALFPHLTVGHAASEPVERMLPL